MAVSANEMGFFSAAGMTIGGEQCGSQTVGGIPNVGSSGITSVAATKPMGMLGSCAEIGYDERIVVRAQAPPTPPPNA